MIKDRKANAEYLELFAWLCIVRGVISPEQGSLTVQFMRWSDPVWQLVPSKVEDSTPTTFLLPYLGSGCALPQSTLYQLLLSSENSMSTYHALASVPQQQEEMKVWLLKRDAESCN